MAKSDKDLSRAEEYDKKAQEHIKKVIEWGQSAINASNPEEREKCAEMARKERQAAIDALTDANVVLWL
jgi:predicted nucleic acid-binding protein